MLITLVVLSALTKTQNKHTFIPVPAFSGIIYVF